LAKLAVHKFDRTHQTQAPLPLTPGPTGVVSAAIPIVELNTARGGTRDQGERLRAKFKRLTRTAGEGQEIDVNMDAVVHLQWQKDHTSIHFALPVGDYVHTVAVKETPDEIHLRGPLPQAR
jgi:hypothetical protein